MAETRVKELLTKLRSGAQFGNIQLKDVKEALSDEAFLTVNGLLTINNNGSTLLHLAAQTKVLAVLPLVIEEYKRLNVFSDAMLKLNNKLMNPLHVAIAASRCEGVVLLFKECVELCPQALEPNEEGWTLMHSAVQSPENLNIVKYLLSHDICKPMLLSMGKGSQQNSGPLLPLDIAREQLEKNENFLRKAEVQKEHSVKIAPRKKVVEKSKELLSVVEQHTAEMKAMEAKRLAEDLAQRKLLEMTEKTKNELQQLLLASDWETVVDKYWLSKEIEVQKITVTFLGERHTIEGLSETQLPQLTFSMLQVLAHCLDLEEHHLTVKGALKLLRESTRSKEDNAFILGQEELGVSSKMVHLLTSLDVDIQQLCAAILLNIFNHKPDSFVSPTKDSEMVETLLLVKHFSQNKEARSLSSDVLVCLGVKRKQPDPGSWTVRQVSFWMENNMDLDQRVEFSRSFREANINGLHLLELTSAEMTGLGVKYVSHQRKIASLIDGLRRMNMRSMVGHKDVFLSYAHININFARRLKVLLNEAKYTVWIDEAGIRAGHKWRNEIADGIQGCNVFLFVMTPRSANSVYCQDEIALAEEYHKPIITVRLEAASEMDPGLKLIIQRRQWIDFMDENLFESNKVKLIGAVTGTMGPGSGPEPDERDKSEEEEVQHTSESDTPQKCPGGETKTLDALPEAAALVVKDLLEQEVGKVRTELLAENHQLREEVKQLRLLVEELTKRINDVMPREFY